MRPLVRLAVAFRRASHALAMALVVLGLGTFVLLEARSPLLLPIYVGIGGTLLGLIVHRAVHRYRLTAVGLGAEIELGLLSVLGAYFAVLRFDGGLGGDLYPLVLLTLGVVAALSRPAASAAAVLLGVALELAIAHQRGTGSLREAGYHTGFMVAITAFNAGLLRAEVFRVRSLAELKIHSEIEKAKLEARNFRLLAPTAEATSARTADDRLMRSGVEEIHQSVLFALRLVRESLGLHTTMLLWQTDSGDHYRISELVTDDPDFSEGPYAAGDGILGAVTSRAEIVTLSGLKESYVLPYYGSTCPVRAVCVVPVSEHGKLRGLLVADRVRDQPFTEREQSVLEEASRYAVRAIHNERVFLQLERGKAEQGKLYRATEALSSAKSEESVIEAGVQSAREVTSVDYAALTLFDEKSRVHEIRVVSGDFEDGDGSAVVGSRFKTNAGLVSMALENRHPLPYRGKFDERRQVVFTRHLTPPSMPSILVLPLTAHDRPLGTLVLGSRRKGAFGDGVRGTLEVLASHMAVSLEGARMIKRLEELATTDPLTGLLNKRAMLETAEQKIASAARFGRHLSVLVTDIDHFKKVNDNYGHDVGDVIIKGLGAILSKAKRTTDAVARFGGEEFVIICEETDERGAMLLAERVRQELERTIFSGGPGADGKERTLSVTCSIGIATFPQVGSQWETLFKAADTALYASKQGGRNRTSQAPSAERAA